MEQENATLRAQNEALNREMARRQGRTDQPGQDAAPPAQVPQPVGNAQDVPPATQPGNHPPPAQAVALPAPRPAFPADIPRQDAPPAIAPADAPPPAVHQQTRPGGAAPVDAPPAVRQPPAPAGEDAPAQVPRGRYNPPQDDAPPQGRAVEAGAFAVGAPLVRRINPSAAEYMTPDPGVQAALLQSNEVVQSRAKMGETVARLLRADNEPFQGPGVRGSRLRLTLSGFFATFCLEFYTLELDGIRRRYPGAYGDLMASVRASFETQSQTAAGLGFCKLGALIQDRRPTGGPLTFYADDPAAPVAEIRGPLFLLLALAYPVRGFQSTSWCLTPKGMSDVLVGLTKVVLDLVCTWYEEYEDLSGFSLAESITFRSILGFSMRNVPLPQCVMDVLIQFWKAAGISKINAHSDTVDMNLAVINNAPTTREGNARKAIHGKKLGNGPTPQGRPQGRSLMPAKADRGGQSRKDWAKAHRSQNDSPKQ